MAGSRVHSGGRDEVNLKMYTSATNGSRENMTEDYEELDPTTMEFSKLVEFLHPSFVAEYLDKILIFLKSNKTDMCFPNIAPYKESFLMKLASDTENLHCESFDSTGHTICRDILKVLDSNRNVYRWRCHYESATISKRVLVYEKEFLNSKLEKDTFKVPRNNSEERECTWRSSNVRSLERSPRRSLESADHPEVEWGDTALSKRQKNYKQLFDMVTVPFIVSSLQTITDFYGDERTELELPQLTPDEARFMKTLASFPFKSNLVSVVPAEWLGAVRAFRLAVGKPRNITIREGKGRGPHKLRNVTIIKSHKGGKKATTRVEEKATPIDYNPREMFLKALSLSSEETQSRATDDVPPDRSQATERPDPPERSDRHERSERHDRRERSRDRDRDRDRDRGRDRDRDRDRNDRESRGDKKKAPKPGPVWQSAGTLDPAEGAAATGVPDRARRRMPASKIVEGLMRPVENDIAIRMMKRMGWDGGALGLHGKGITEPIMPALDIVSGAGLGHSPTRARRERMPSAARAAFRVELLQNILELTRAKDQEERVVKFPHKLTAKEVKCASLICAALSARRNVGLNGEEERELVCRAAANMHCQPALALRCDAADAGRQIIIRKTARTCQASKRRRRRDATDADDAPQLTLDSCQLSSDNCQSVSARDVDALVARLQGLDTGANARPQAYRIIFLKKVLDFVKSAADSLSVRFEEPLPPRAARFLAGLVATANKRARQSYSCSLENDLYARVRDAIDCCLLVGVASNARSFTLQKKKYQNRFYNTSRTRLKDDDKPERRDGDRDGDGNDGDDKPSSRQSRRAARSPPRAASKRATSRSASESGDSVISIDCDVDLDADLSDYPLEGASSDDSDHEASTGVATGDNAAKSDTAISDGDGVELNSIIDLLDGSKVTADSDNLSPGSSKRSRSASQGSEGNAKRAKVESKVMAVRAKADGKMDRELAARVQTAILGGIEKERPLLKCEGLSEFGLVYVCLNEATQLWLQTLIDNVNTDEAVRLEAVACPEFKKSGKVKMAARTTSFVEESYVDIFKRIETFNPSVRTTDWTILQERQADCFRIAEIEMDRESFVSIACRNYSVYAGIDKVEFSRLWE